MRQDLGLSKLQAKRVIAHLHRTSPWQPVAQGAEIDDGSGDHKESCRCRGEDNQVAHNRTCVYHKSVSGVCSSQSSLGLERPDRLSLRGGGTGDTEEKGSSSTCGASRRPSDEGRGDIENGLSDSSLDVDDDGTDTDEALGDEEGLENSLFCSEAATAYPGGGGIPPGISGTDVDATDTGEVQGPAKETSSHGEVVDWCEQTGERMIQTAFENESLDLMAAYHILGVPQDDEG
jgi:hypothetical protein